MKWRIDAARPVLVVADDQILWLAPGTGALVPAGQVATDGRDDPVASVLYRGELRRVTVARDVTAWFDDGTRALPAGAGQARVVAALSHPDRSLVLTGGDDGVVRLWSIDDGVELDQLVLDPPVRQIVVVPGWQRGGAPVPDAVVVRAGRAAFVLDLVVPEGRRTCDG